jgi:hypothetical protein
MPFQPGNQWGKISKRGKARYKTLIKNVCDDEFFECFSKVRLLRVNELQQGASDPKSNGLYAGMCSCFLHFIKEGDFSRIKDFYAQIVGKPSDNIKIQAETKQTLIMQINDNDW